jgi:hypothetical protein
MDAEENLRIGHVIAMWLGRIDEPKRLNCFQIIDSMVWSFVHMGLAFNSDQFDFDPAQHGFASLVAMHLRSLTDHGVNLVCRHIAPYRPPTVPLPILMPGNPNAALGVQLGQPARCNFATYRDVNDHAWRGLVVDHDHALSIMKEYQQLGNNTARDLVQRFERRHNLQNLQALNNQELDRIRLNLAEQKTYVQRLFEAMVDFDDIIDRPQKVRAPKPRAKRSKRKHADSDHSGEEHREEEIATADLGLKDNPQVTRVKGAPDVLLESLCWILLDAIIEAQRGNIMISPWQKMSDKRLYEPFETFHLRLDAVLEALRMSKAFVDNLLQCNMLRALAAAPGDNLFRKKANKTTNTLRTLQVKIGDAYLKQTIGASTTSTPQANEEQRLEEQANEEQYNGEELEEPEQDNADEEYDEEDEYARSEMS